MKVVIDDPTLNYGKTRHQISQPAQEVQGWTAAAILAIKYRFNEQKLNKQGAIPIKAIDPSKIALEEELLSA